MKNFFKNIRCATGEIAPTYEDFLQTRHWKGLRIQVAERDQYTCQRCSGVFKRLFTIHHNTYKYLGKERLKDLTFYCSKCHAVIHNDRKNTHAFNRSYNAQITQAMRKMNEEQIEKVLEFMESLIAKPVKVKLTCRTCEKENLIDCQRCLNGKGLPFHTSKKKAV
jgi:hypothetical protein